MRSIIMSFTVCKCTRLQVSSFFHDILTWIFHGQALRREKTMSRPVFPHQMNRMNRRLLGARHVPMSELSFPIFPRIIYRKSGLWDREITHHSTHSIVICLRITQYLLPKGCQSTQSRSVSGAVAELLKRVPARHCKRS